MGLNKEQLIPFSLNERVWGIWDSVNAEKDLIGSSSFWAQTLVIAYQPAASVDMDPDEEGRGRLFGVTVKKGMNTGYSVVFIEMFRDEALGGSRSVNFPWSENTVLTAREGILSRFHGVIAHEVGHAPGKQSEPGDHNEGGLMRGDVEDEPPPSMSDDFTPASIRRFRSVGRWGN